MDEHPLLTPFLRDLHNNGRLRVWSIVITVFGDAVQPRQMPMPISELLQLTENLGVGSSALRTAMSRLAKEGWVDRQRDGRNSFYTLNASGRNTFLKASERIYQAAFTSQSSDWLVACYEDAASVPDTSSTLALPLGRRSLLSCLENRKAINDDKALLLQAHPDSVPEWTRDRLLSEQLLEQYRQLLRNLEPLLSSDAGDGGLDNMTPLTAMTLRCVIIHQWRRLVLRHPVLPQGLMPDNWAGASAHRALTDLYPRLVSRSEPWWREPTSEHGEKILAARFR